jgi:protein SCO1/2
LAGAARAAGSFDPFNQAGVDQRPGAAAPMSLPLTDETGARTNLAALGHGQPILLAPIQHRCPNICGLTLEGLANAVRGQALAPGRDFQVIAFGFDPHETAKDAEVSATRLRARLGAAGIHAVVAGPGETRATLKAIGYRYAWDPRLQQYAHIAAFAVLTPDGRVTRWVYGIQPQGDDLGRALGEARGGKAWDWGQQLLLLCFHYDPSASRNGATIWLVLRLGGALTVALLAAAIGWAALGEWRRRVRAA